MSRLRAGRPANRGSIPGRDRFISLLHSVHTDFSAISASYSASIVGFSQGRAAGVCSYYSLYLVLKFRKNGAVPPIQYAASRDGA